MAQKIFRINYKSDFLLTLESDAGWMTPFCIKFFTGAPSRAYYVGWDGTTYMHCSYDPSEPTKLQVQFDDHHLPVGDLKFQIAYHFTVADFPNNTEDEVINPANITTEIDGQEYQVMLDFTGETAPEIQFSLPAYANEVSRIENELQRQENELARQENELARQEAELEREQATAAAVQGAENVNAQLNGTILTVTNRNGVSTSSDVQGPQGETGATPVIDATASVDDNVGIPMVTVESFGPADNRTFDFAFKNLKGEPGNYTKPADGIPLSDLDGNVASGIVYDVTANNSGATFASLSALLSSGSLSTLIPTFVRKGGMQIRFVQSSDNKYVQFLYMPSDASTVATFTNVANWQGVDATPTAGSRNLVDSGGVFGILKNYNQTISTTGIVIPNVVVGKTLVYDFSNNDRKVACIGFFDNNDTLVGSYIGNTSSGGSAGHYSGEVVVPTNSVYLKAVASEAFDLILYYKDSVYKDFLDVEKEFIETNSKFNDVYDYDTTYVDIFNPSTTSLFIPQNELCFTYDNYKVSDAMPVVAIYAPIVAGGTMEGSVNLVMIDGSGGTLLLSEQFEIHVDADGYGYIFFNSEFNDAYTGANVCLQLTTKSVPIRSGLSNTGFKYYDPSNGSVTSYNTYIGEFTIAKENPFAKKQYVKDEITKAVAAVGVCTPSDDLQEFITNNRIVNLIAGTYNISSTLTIPSNTKIVGVRGGTIIKLNGATTAITFEDGEANIQIENITFDGNDSITRASKTVSQIRSRDGIGSNKGIYFSGHTTDINICYCEFKNFSHSGIHLYQTMESSGQQAKNVKIEGCSFANCWTGILLDKRAEFHTIIDCSFNQCMVGAYVCGGNNAFCSCRFDLNGTGFVVYGASSWNDSHGQAANSSFDHNLGYGIVCTGVNYGYTFTNCHVFDGTGIIISDSVGVGYVGGIIACEIIVDSPRNAGFNLIHDVMFGNTASYYTGTITGDTTRLSLKNNRFLSQDDYSSINNAN